MALLNKNEINNTNSTISILSKLDTALFGILNTKKACENDIRTNYQKLQTVQTDRILENMDIEKINVDKDGIRVTTLKNAGIRNILQVSKMSAAELQEINGIGEGSASKIVNNAKLLRMNIEKSVQVILSAGNPNPQTNAIVKGLYFLIQNDTILKNSEQLYGTYHDLIKRHMESVRIMSGNFKWMLASKQKKNAAKQAADQLDQIVKGDFGTTASGIIEEYNRNYFNGTQTVKQSSKMNMVFSKHKVRIIGEIPDLQQSNNYKKDNNDGQMDVCWTDFFQNAASYYAMLEMILGDGIAKGGDSGIASLPEELLASIESYELDLSLLKANLRRYQMFGTKYILHQEKVLLGDEMGLGKTMQAIAAFCHLSGKGYKHFLVVCPLSVVVNWKREIESQSELSVIEVYGEDRAMEMTLWSSNGGVAITTYETLNKIPVPEAVTIDMMVVDEAHYIKNPGAQRTKSVLAAVAKASRILFMSGTPLENRIEEMHFLIGCLQPEIAEQIKDMKQLADAERFREAIAPVYLRRVREDVLKELPELVEKEQWGLMNAEEINAYKKALLEGNFMKVRQVSWQLPDTAKSTKAQRLMEICEDAREGGRKLIIFSFFKDVLVKVSTMLGEYCVGVIDGSVSATDRQRMIDGLKTAKNGSALVCQIQAGGVGLNIQAASVVVFCEPQIKPSLETQAVARAYRMGQSQPVMVHRLLMENSVDERIMEILHKKSELFEHFADESVIGEMDIQVNENAIMRNIIEEEMKRLGLADTV